MATFVMEEAPVPKPVRVDQRERVHLTDDMEMTLCGDTGDLTVVEMELDEIDALPDSSKCLRCARAAHGQARIKRLIR